MKHTKKKVLVGMSGGIDSSAVCLMLQAQGYDVAGLTMRVWDLPRQFSSPEQELPDFIQEARNMAAQLGIPHYVADERTAFKESIVKNFIHEYMEGRTPNPCVMCNPMFKFRVLTEWADKLGCDYIATGHYVRVAQEMNRYVLYCGKDEKKDQSYFLWRLGQEVLSRCIFPLGELQKKDVRDYLKQEGFQMKASEGESMEVCFIDKDYREFLREQVPDLDRRVGKGKFVDLKGNVIGVHRGVPYFTVGQRKKLGIALGKPAYVLRLNAQKNTVMLGDMEDLDTYNMLVADGQMADESFFEDGNLSVRIRYRSRPIPCRVRRMRNLFPSDVPGKDIWMVQFKEKASAVTPGQSAVFYVGDKLVGGGYICTQRGLQAYLQEDDRTADAI